MSASAFENAFRDAPTGAALARVGGAVVEANERLLEILGRSRDETLGTLVLQYIHPEERDEVTQLWRQVVVGRLQRFTSRVRFIRRDGSDVGVVTSVSLTRDARGRAHMVQVHVLDPTDAVRIERELRSREAELRRALRRMRATTALAGTLAMETGAEEILDVVARRGRTLVDAHSLAVLIDDGDELVVAAAAGDHQERWTGLRVPRRSPVIARALASIDPVHTLASRDASSLAGAGLAPCSAALLVRLGSGLTQMGLLVAIDRVAGGPEFGTDDGRLLRAYALTAASAISTARSLETERLRRVVESSERERSRIAADLHDDVLQRLGAVRLSLSMPLSGGADEPVHRAARAARDELASLIEDIRSLILELRPAALDQLGLAAALEALVEQKAQQSRLAIRLEARIEARGAPAPEVENAVYRIVQEALTNVEKHAGATQVRVSAIEQEGVIDLSVEDDGRGFEDDRSAAGFGLLGMSDRAAAVGGELQVSSTPGKGSRVNARLPLEVADE